VYRRKARAGQSGALHVYIEGDGRPFLEPTTVAFDPTPRDPLMLRLMALDPAPSVYLGRPCYFGLDHDRGCNPAYWTVRRFAPEVVDSLAAALRSEAARSAARSIELYGHSGGGTLMVGSGDTNTPPALVESAALKTGAIGSVRIVPGYTHNCCWQEIWSGVVSDGADRRDSRQSGSENP
jgi:hypothetical protein